jgi:hypothetical protein
VADYVHEPEVFRAGEKLPIYRDPFIEKLAWMMDGMIPVGRWSFGLDSVIGLVPVLGDIIGAAVGMLIVLRAVQAGIPRVAIARMMTNIAIDTFVGAIPFLGDAFDFVYKSNTKNLRIYEEAVVRRRGASARHWAFFAALFVGVGAVVALAILGLLVVIRSFQAF